MNWIANLVEHRKVNPGKARSEPGTPDHVLHVESAVVVQHRHSSMDAYDPSYPLNTGRDQIFGLDPNQRGCAMEKIRALFAADRRVQRKNAVADESNHAE